MEPKLADNELWPGTQLSWSILLGGITIVTAIFGLVAVAIPGLAAVQLAKQSKPEAHFFLLFAAMVTIPLLVSIILFRRLGKLTAGSECHTAIQRTFWLGQLLLLLFYYLPLDLLLLKLIPLTSVLGSKLLAVR